MALKDMPSWVWSSYFPPARIGGNSGNRREGIQSRVTSIYSLYSSCQHKIMELLIVGGWQRRLTQVKTVCFGSDRSDQSLVNVSTVPVIYLSNLLQSRRTIFLPVNYSNLFHSVSIVSTMRVQSVFTYYCTRYKSKHLSLYVCIERKIERVCLQCSTLHVTPLTHVQTPLITCSNRRLEAEASLA